MENQAGQASIVLQLDLGYPLPPPHLPRHVTPVQHRRRARREAARRNAEEATENINEVSQPATEQAADATIDDTNKETEQVTEETEAEESEQVDEAIADVALNHEPTAEEAEPNFSCYHCNFEGKNLRAINAHVGRVHKADGCSPIPQLDGEAGNLDENDGKEAFTCEMTFIPMCYMCMIYVYESCRKHVGAIKCKDCALDLIGLDNIRMHMETCHEPA